MYVEVVNKEIRVCHDPPVGKFRESMVDALDEYYQKLVRVDSLLGDLLIKSNKKIVVFNPMKREIT